MFNFFRFNRSQPALPVDSPPPPSPGQLLPLPTASAPPGAGAYPPRLGSVPIFFDSSFTLRLARPYDDDWASDSSLLASPTVPVAVWVRNQRDELVAHHIYTSAPIRLGETWLPGIYSLQIQHPDFRDVLCACKQGLANALMPPLDLRLPLESGYDIQPLDAGTSAMLMS